MVSVMFLCCVVFVCLLVGWLVGRLVGWLFGCLVVWLVGWLVGWRGSRKFYCRDHWDDPGAANALPQATSLSDWTALCDTSNMDVCEICLQWDEGESMLECDVCELGYHMACLSPPLTSVPEGECGAGEHRLQAVNTDDAPAPRQARGCAPSANATQTTARLPPPELVQAPPVKAAKHQALLGLACQTGATARAYGVVGQCRYHRVCGLQACDFGLDRAPRCDLAVQDAGPGALCSALARQTWCHARCHHLQEATAEAVLH